MHSEVLLDRQGDLPTPLGYQVIATEVDFLCYATDDSPLLIRGERLCAWAESFYNLRGRPYGHQQSPSAAMQKTFPALSQQQAGELAQKMGVVSVASEEMSAAFVLSLCYPEDQVLWQGVSSREHVARWLIWLNAHQPTQAESVILQALCADLTRQAGDAPEAQLYQAKNKTEAKRWLQRWLGLEEEWRESSLGEFPLALPTELLNEVKAEWTKQLIATKGSYFDRMLAFPLPIALRRELAELAAQFYEQHIQLLTRQIIWQLHPYLLAETLAVLENILPPAEPSSMPLEEAAVLNWFLSEYLPYRRWQAKCGDEQARELACHHAQTFARWYLSRYPQWLLQSQWISFQQSAQLRESKESVVTLCVILDGLPAWDAEDLAGQVSAKIARLQLIQRAYCFGPLPTVTEFAKDALFKGVPPRLSPEVPPLGKILPDDASPVQDLKKAQPGDLLFWRVSQPDTVYHFEKAAKRERQVRAELESILQAVREIVESLPTSITLRVIVTSDHGRLLNPKSPRQLPTPTGMQAHGRVAWGKLDLTFNENGFAVDETVGTIAVHGERFEMAHDMIIAWGEETFRNVKAGPEPYPHGGLFPEEAIVPWFVFERDAKTPVPDITISGKGEAKLVGSLEIAVINTSRIMLECLSVSLSHGVQVSGNWQIPPLAETRFSHSLSPWPAKSDLEKLKATLLFRQPNGTTFTSEVIPQLQAEALYEQPDDLLKELDL